MRSAIPSSIVMGLTVAIGLSPAVGRAAPPTAGSPTVVRTVSLVGYGLVVGLSDTGDDLARAPLAAQTLKIYYERAGVPGFDPSLMTARSPASW